MHDEARIARMEDIVQPILKDHGLMQVDLEWHQGPRGL
jgi:hypothetical protein